jgi:hypothetical protein
MVPNRTHNYIDIENLACRGVLSFEDVTQAKLEFERIVHPEYSDLFTIGCDAANAFQVRAVFTGARIVWGHGPDGADLALMDAIRGDVASGTVASRVNLGSGDHIFAPLLATLASLHVITRVVGVAGHTSARLRLAAHETAFLPQPSAHLYEWTA